MTENQQTKKATKTEKPKTTKPKRPKATTINDDIERET
jgi:hypothetical protein